MDAPAAIADRARGALLGLALGKYRVRRPRNHGVDSDWHHRTPVAVGDALGTTVEFCKPGSFEPVHDLQGGGPFKLLAGQWTDDTSLALCLAESLIHNAGDDAAHQLETYA